MKFTEEPKNKILFSEKYRILNRDSNCCKRCGSKDNLTHFQKKSEKDYNGLQLSDDAYLTLCRNCFERGVKINSYSIEETPVLSSKYSPQKLIIEQKEQKGKFKNILINIVIAPFAILGILGCLMFKLLLLAIIPAFLPYVLWCIIVNIYSVDTSQFDSTIHILLGICYIILLICIRKINKYILEKIEEKYPELDMFGDN